MFPSGITGNFGNTSVGLAQIQWGSHDMGFLKKNLRLVFDMETLDFEAGVPQQFVGRTVIRYRQEFTCSLAEFSAPNMGIGLGQGAASAISIPQGVVSVPGSLVPVSTLGATGIKGARAVGGNLTSVFVAAPTTFAITAAVDNSGTTAGTTKFTAANHGLTTGQSVIITGSTVSGYNGTYVATVVDSSHFYVTLAYSATATATGRLQYKQVANGVAGDYFVDPGNYVGSGKFEIIPGSGLDTQVTSSPNVWWGYSYDPGSLDRIVPGSLLGFEVQQAVITHLRPNSGKFVRATQPSCMAKGTWTFGMEEREYWLSDFSATAIPNPNFVEPYSLVAAPYGYVDFQK